MKNFDWLASAAFVSIIATLATLALVMTVNMKQADRFAACELRGGLMKNVGGELQCVAGVLE